MELRNEDRARFQKMTADLSAIRTLLEKLVALAEAAKKAG